MKKAFFNVTLFTVLLAAGFNVQAQQRGWMSRYWDGCKAHCSWTGNAGSNPYKECNASNTEITRSDQNRSSCDGGVSFTCWDQIPFVDPDNPNLAYAFAAVPASGSACGTCYELTFDGGFQHGVAGQTHQALSSKRLIVMATNIGHDVGGGQFDVMIPGGGVGQFDSFSRQLGIPVSQLGATYGGLLTTCGNPTNLTTAQTCLRNACNDVFSAPAHALLRQGCLFYADWFMAANNPTMTYRTVPCPTILANRYRPGSGGSTPTPGGGGSGPTTYTITFNPNGSGATVTPTSGTTGTNGRLTSLPTPTRANHTFNGWFTAASGGMAVTTATTFSANTTVFAQWTPNAVTTYTLTVSRNPTGGGSVTVGTQQNPGPMTHNAGAQVTVAASPSQGYTFTNWTGAPQGVNASSASITITMNSNLTLTANFQQQTGGIHTITFNPNGSGATVNPSSATTGANGRLTTLPTPTRDAHTFNGWFTATTGGQEVTTNTVFSANTTIFARWTPQGGPTAYTVTFNPSSGTVNPTSATTGTNGRLTSLPTPTRANHTFTGWFTTAIGGTQITTATVFTQNTTVFAQWTQQGGGGDGHMILTINIEPSGAGRVDVDPDKGGFNQSENISLTAVSNFGYTFRHWEGGDLGSWSTDLTVSTNMWSDRTIIARFEPTVSIIKEEASITTTAPLVRTQTAIRPFAKGFTATLPTSHGYTSYRLIDIQGRGVKSGQIGVGAMDLHFSNLRSGIYFLRLSGQGNMSTVLKAVTY